MWMAAAPTFLTYPKKGTVPGGKKEKAMSGKMTGKRIAMALVAGGAGVATVVALAGTALATTGGVSNVNITPGNEVCVAVAASTSVSAVGVATAPGLKFRLIAQDGTVITATSGPVTKWAPYIYAGGPGWDGAGDYTACAKNNGTQTVNLNYLTVQGN
jgi:hypothetical protein